MTGEMLQPPLSHSSGDQPQCPTMSARRNLTGRGVAAIDSSASFNPLQRSFGRLRLSFKMRGARTVLDELYQNGCCKARLPRALPGEAQDAQAILINTAGGLADGDDIATEITWGPHTRAQATSQAAERVYRARLPVPAMVSTKLEVGAGALAYWLPQETILFNGGRVTRKLSAEIAAGGLLVACDSTVFGRRAMGERVHAGAFREDWNICYNGALVYADRLEGEGDIDAMLARPSIAAGGAAIGSIIIAGAHGEALLPVMRDLCAKIDAHAGASYRDQVVIMRVVAPDGQLLRAGLMTVLSSILQNLKGAPLGRNWYC